MKIKELTKEIQDKTGNLSNLILMEILLFLNLIIR